MNWIKLHEEGSGAITYGCQVPGGMLYRVDRKGWIGEHGVSLATGLAFVPMDSEEVRKLLFRARIAKDGTP